MFPSVCDFFKVSLYIKLYGISFNPASLFFASSTSTIPGSAFFPEVEKFLVVLYGLVLPAILHLFKNILPSLNLT